MGLSFKEILQQDVKQVFLNPLEFGETHLVNGEPMTISSDDIENIEREKKMKSSMDGIFTRQVFFYVASADFGPLPKEGGIGIVNKFIDGINTAIGIINAIPGVSINPVQKLEVPQLAKGGIVTAPTLLEAGEAGDEAIIPLPELWGNMQDMIAATMNGATDGIAALADRLDAATAGAEDNGSVSDLLSKLDSLGNGDGYPDGDGNPPMQIIYSPTNHYHFEGEAPSKEDIAGAESMSQDEFDRMMAQWLKDQKRKNFRG